MEWWITLLAVFFALMLLFSVDWKDIGDILNFPFGALGGGRRPSRLFQ